MSYLTHVLISGASKDAMAKVNAWLNEHDTGRHQQFTEIDFDAAGGTKYWCRDVWAACFNYCPVDLFDVLRDPDTWSVGILSVQIQIDDENFSEIIAFSSGGNTFTGYTRTAHSVYRSDYDDGVEYRTFPKAEEKT